MSGGHVDGDRRPETSPLSERETDKPRRRAPVFVYLAVLFVAAFLMLLLAYFMQVRNDSVDALPRTVSRGTCHVVRPEAHNDHIFAIIP